MSVADVQEWNYGDYEGKVTAEIREERGGPWDIVSQLWHEMASNLCLTLLGLAQWTDGCAGGESAQQVSDRCDAMIEKIVGHCR